MQRAKKALALLLVLVFFVLFGASACHKKTDDGTGSDVPKVASESDIVIPYSREDGLNPYMAKSLLNQILMPLLYNGLFSVAEDYSVTPVIAESASFSGPNLIVTIKKDAKFADGSPITANDVAYSFTKAKNSVYYSTTLNEFATATAQGDDTVTFTMISKNLYATAVLTFPIIKLGTSIAADVLPTGTGMYTYEATADGGILHLNEGYSGKTRAVYLTNITHTNTLLDSLGVGNMDFAYDEMMDGKLQRVRNINECQVPLNQIVVLGVNTGRSYLSNPTIRVYLSALLDREALITTGLDGYADPSVLPFNPAWYEIKNLELPRIDTKVAKATVADHFKGMKLNILTDESNDYKMKLADAVSKQLAAIGVDSTITALPYTTYKSAVSGHMYDLYIGEYRLTNDMNIGFLLSGDIQEQFRYVQTGSLNLEKYIEYYYSQMPMITIGFRNAVLCYGKEIVSDVTGLPGNPLGNLPNFEKEV